MIQTFTVSPDSAVFPCSSFSTTFQSVLAFSWTGFSHLYWSPEGSAFLLIFGGQSLPGNIPPLGNSGLITAEQRPPRQGLQAKSSQLPDITHQVLLDHSHALWLTHRPWLLSHCKGRVERLAQRTITHSLKYLQSGPGQKFADL